MENSKRNSNKKANSPLRNIPLNHLIVMGALDQLSHVRKSNTVTFMHILTADSCENVIISNLNLN